MRNEYLGGGREREIRVLRFKRARFEKHVYIYLPRFKIPYQGQKSIHEWIFVLDKEF